MCHSDDILLEYLDNYITSFLELWRILDIEVFAVENSIKISRQSFLHEFMEQTGDLPELSLFPELKLEGNQIDEEDIELLSDVQVGEVSIVQKGRYYSEYIAIKQLDKVSLNFPLTIRELKKAFFRLGTRLVP